MIDIFSYLHTNPKYIRRYIEQLLFDIKNNSTISNQCEIEIINNTILISGEILDDIASTMYLIKIKPKKKDYYIEIKFYGDWYMYTSQLFINVRMNNNYYNCFFDPIKKCSFTGWNLWFLWIDTKSIINLIIYYIKQDNKNNYIYY
jgi:hypothetical protein